jgi:DNA-binding response OmpR family regulator
MLPHVRILVADDDTELLGTIATALERAGAEVVRAESGAELLERIADEEPFGLVITDVAMPWLNGLYALHSARTVGHETPVIVMTALKDDRLPDQVRALGQNAVLLRKPFSLEDLESAALRLLSPPERAPAR